MRMWMVNPKIMCKNHLIGEYRELFTFQGALKKRMSIKGWIRNNCLEPLSIKQRYEELKAEMIRRNYKPKKEFVMNDMSHLSHYELNYKVDRDASLKDLLHRCDKCNQLHRELNNEVL